MISTDINYPSNLPYPTRDGYSAQYTSPLMRTKTISGRAIQRRQFTTVPAMYNVSWIFTTDGDAAAFEAWFRDVVKDGTEWFNCPMRTPIGTGQYVCRFTDIYEGPNPYGVCGWTVRAELEMFERPLMPEGWGILPDYIAMDDIFDVAMNDRWPKANQ